jgi:hypothetical protein
LQALPKRDSFPRRFRTPSTSFRQISKAFQDFAASDAHHSYARAASAPIDRRNAMAEVAAETSRPDPIIGRRLRLAVLLKPLFRWIGRDWQRDVSLDVRQSQARSGADLSWQTGLSGHDVRRMIDHAHR